MELTDRHLEEIKEAVREVRRYGSVTINVAADTVDLIVQKRLRLEKEPTEHNAPMCREEGRGYRT